MKTIGHPWILACDGTNKDYPFGFACTRCGAREALEQPRIGLSKYLERQSAFVAQHRDCDEKEGGARS